MSAFELLITAVKIDHEGTCIMKVLWPFFGHCLDKAVSTVMANDLEQAEPRRDLYSRHLITAPAHPSSAPCRRVKGLGMAQGTCQPKCGCRTLSCLQGCPPLIPCKMYSSPCRTSSRSRRGFPAHASASGTIQANPSTRISISAILLHLLDDRRTSRVFLAQAHIAL